MTDDRIASLLTEIRNWTRAASFGQVRAQLEAALPDPKSRAAYQMLDGTATAEQVRVACKMSPNAVVALIQKCTAMGLMETGDNKKRARLFDLADFGLIKGEDQAQKER